jgi:uncharacterized protein YndB with AHSA1/START domain
MDFEISVQIAAAPDTVWSVIADTERWHEWTPSVRRIRRLDRGPMRIGSLALVRQPRLPPAIWKVTALEPDRSFTWRSGMPGMWVYGEHSVVGHEGGARATLALHFVGVFGGALGRLTRTLTERYLRFEADGLKRRSEELART